MRKWIIGFVVGLAAAVAGLAFAHNQLLTKLQQVTELTEQLMNGQEQIYHRLGLTLAEARVAKERVHKGLSQPDLRRIHGMVMQAVHGCSVIAYGSPGRSDLPPPRYQIECPLFGPQN